MLLEDFVEHASNTVWLGAFFARFVTPDFKSLMLAGFLLLF